MSKNISDLVQTDWFQDEQAYVKFMGTASDEEKQWLVHTVASITSMTGKTHGFKHPPELPKHRSFLASDNFIAKELDKIEDECKRTLQFRPHQFYKEIDDKIEATRLKRREVAQTLDKIDIQLKELQEEKELLRLKLMYSSVTRVPTGNMHINREGQSLMFTFHKADTENYYPINKPIMAGNGLMEEVTVKALHEAFQQFNINRETDGEQPLNFDYE